MKEKPVYEQFDYMFSVIKLLGSWTCKNCREKISNQEQFILDCWLYNKQYPLILLLLRECISPAFLCKGCWEHAHCEALLLHKCNNMYRNMCGNQIYLFV